MADIPEAPSDSIKRVKSGTTAHGKETGPYVGLSEQSRLWILGLGAVIACLNLIVAWFLAHETLVALRLSDADVAPFRALFSDTSVSASSRHDLLARSMHIVALNKMIGNKQGLVLACFGGAFALAAIGFSLFVIGADGAFKVSATTSSKAKLVLTGTAPGLLCFAIFGWLMTRGVEQKSSMELPPFITPTPTAMQYQQIIGAPAGSTTAPCDKTNLDGKCLSNADFEKLAQEAKK
jgi:hypothetical protein